jgi:hypothetical protein
MPGPSALGTTELLGALAVDARELIGAHADQLRGALAGDVRDLRATLLAYIFAAAVAIVAAIAIAAAVAVTLVHAGLSWLAALWIVAFAPTALAALLARRARTNPIGEQTAHALATRTSP